MPTATTQVLANATQVAPQVAQSVSTNSAEWLIPYVIIGAILVGGFMLGKYVFPSREKEHITQKTLGGKKLVEQETSKDITEKIKTLGQRHFHALNFFYLRVRGINHGWLRIGKVMYSYRQTVKAGKKGEPTDVTYFLIIRRGIINYIKALFGKYDVLLVGSEFVTAHSDFSIQPSVDLDKHNGIWIQINNALKDVTENITWKIVHQDTLGQYTDMPRKISYLGVSQATQIEKLAKETELEQEREKRRLRSVM